MIHCTAAKISRGVFVDLLFCLSSFLPSFLGAWYSVLDGHCSTAQGLLDWFEVDLGFTELLFFLS